MQNELKGIPAARGLARGAALHWKETDFDLLSFSPTDLAAEKDGCMDSRLAPLKYLS